MRRLRFHSAFDVGGAMSSGPRSTALVATLVALTATSSGQENKVPGVAASIGQEVRAIFSKCQRAVVKIEATDEHGDLSGSGFFIDPNGTLYTSYTIGGNSRDIAVLVGGERCNARRLIADPRSGVALLKVETKAPCPFLPIGQSKQLAPGDPLIAIGYPMDLPASPSWGTLAGFDLKYLGRYFATRHIRANLAVQRGQGGAPLLNMQGEAVGILISSLDGGSGCFSLPIEAAERVRKDFVHHGDLRPGWLGVGCTEAPAPIAGSSARVDALVEGSPGAKAGVQPGDVLLKLGNREIASAEDVLDAAFFIGAEDEIRLKVSRGEEILELTASAVERPKAPRTAGDIPAFAPSIGGSDLRGWPMLLDR